MADADYDTPHTICVPLQSSGTPRIDLQESVDQTLTTPGSTLTYTIDFTNIGDNSIGSTDSGVQIVDAIPANTTYAPASATCSLGATCVIAWSTDGGATYTQVEPAAASVTHIRWSVNQALAPAAMGSAGFQAVVDNPFTGTVTNTARLRIDNGPFLLEDSVDTGVGLDELFLAADFGYQPPAPSSPTVTAFKSSLFEPAMGDNNGDGVLGPGDVLSYSVVVENTGPVDATAVVFSDTPDANTNLVSGSVTTSAGSVTSGNGGGETAVGVDLGTMTVGAMVTITFEVTINDPLPAGVTEIFNQGDVSGGNFTPLVTDNPGTSPQDDPTVDLIAPPPVPIPTASEWGMILLSLFLAMGGLFFLRRQVL